MTIQLLQSASQGWKCQQCGLPGIRLSTRPGSSGVTSRAYYKCVPCNRSLGLCPCTTPGDRTTSTCPCSDSESSDVESPGLEDQTSSFPIFSSKKQTFNPHNPNSGFDEDWEANCTPGFMVSRFKAAGREILF